MRELCPLPLLVQRGGNSLFYSGHFILISAENLFDTNVYLFNPNIIVGYRSIPLLNDYSEELELASLLVKVEIVNPEVSLL